MAKEFFDSRDLAAHLFDWARALLAEHHRRGAFGDDDTDRDNGAAPLKLKAEEVRALAEKLSDMDCRLYGESLEAWRKRLGYPEPDKAAP